MKRNSLATRLTGMIPIGNAKLGLSSLSGREVGVGPGWGLDSVWPGLRRVVLQGFVGYAVGLLDHNRVNEM